MLTSAQVETETAPYLAPISEAEPAGSNPNTDMRYEELRTLMASLDSPTGGEIAWPNVVKQGHTILTKVAKDLLVASYTGYAMFQTKGLDGLAVALTMLNGLIENYWDDMFPPARRLRGRGNALDWFVSRVEAGLPGIEPTAEDRNAFEIIEGEWKTLSSSARDKLADHAPSMRAVSEALQRLRMKLPAAPVEAEPKPEPKPAAPPPSSPTAAAPEPVPEPNTETEPEPEPDPEPDKDPLEVLQEQAKPWLEPIGENKVGEDPRYEEAYETARNEVAKLDSPTADMPEWKLVRKQAGEVIKSKGKDLLMTSYWAYAEFTEGGLGKLPLGLVVLAEMVEQYYEGVFPTRPRGRSNAIGWLVGQLDNALGGVKLEANDRPTVLALEAAAKHLSTTVRNKMEDKAPGMSPLTDRVKRMLLAVPKPEPKAPPPPPPKPTPAATPAPAAAAPAAPRQAAAPSAPMPATANANISNPEEVTKFLLEAGKGLTKAGNLLRGADVANPAAYRLVRQGLWLHIATPPPANAGGKTQIPPLPAPRRKQFETISANGKWAALLEETESALSMFRFCFDLSFLSWTALDGLGHQAAKTAIEVEVAGFLKRLPTLLDLTAGDGSPLASDDTKAWVAGHVLVGDGEGSGGPAVDDPGEDMAEVRKLMKAKKATEAMKLAKQAIDAAGPRMRLLRRLVLAEVVLETGQPLLARGMFSALDQEISERRLLEWETGLAARALEGLVKSIRAANKAGSKYDGADKVFERLCLVDPAAASRLAG